MTLVRILLAAALCASSLVPAPARATAVVQPSELYRSASSSTFGWTQAERFQVVDARGGRVTLRALSN